MQSRKKCHNQFLPLILTAVVFFISNKSVAQVSEEWVRKFKGSTNAMIVDSTGNVFITGIVEADSIINGWLDYDMLTVKYNSSGKLVWSAIFNGNGRSVESPERIQMDKYGNVYITGSTDKLNYLGETNQEWVTIKYNSQGIQQWAKTFDTVGSSYDVDVAYGLAVDNSGNVYVTGESVKALTIKYNSDGERQWVAAAPGYGTGEGVVVDEDENVYVSAAVYNSQNVVEYLLIKYNAQGIEQWRKNIGQNACLACNRDMIALGKNSEIYVAGENGPMKFSKNGDLLWQAPPAGNRIGLGNILLDKSDNIFLVGSKNNGDFKSSAVTAKYNSEGQLLWLKEYNYQNDDFDRATDIALDSSGNSYVSIYNNISEVITGPDDTVFIVTVKYDNMGNLVWEIRFENDSDRNTFAKSIGVDFAGNTYLAGIYRNENNRYNVALIKYSQQTAKHGLCCFDNGFGSQAVCGTHVTPLNCYRSGKNAFFAGYVEDCKTVDTIAICNKTPSSIRIHAQYLEENNSISLTWNKESSGQTPGYYIQRSKDGTEFKTIGYVDVNAAGQYQFNDPYPEIENHYKIVWFEPKGYESNKVLAVALAKEKIQVFPNPTTNKVRIVLKELEEHNSNLIVTDDMGRVKISRRLFKGTTPEIEVSSFPAGIYVIRIEINGKVYRQRFVKK